MRQLIKDLFFVSLGLFVAITLVSVVVIAGPMLFTPTPGYSRSFSLANLVFGVLFLWNLGVCFWLAPHALAAVGFYQVIVRIFSAPKRAIFRQHSWPIVGLLTGTSAAAALYYSNPPMCADEIASWWCVSVQSLHHTNSPLVILGISFAGYLGGRARNWGRASTKVRRSIAKSQVELAIVTPLGRLVLELATNSNKVLQFSMTNKSDYQVEIIRGSEQELSQIQLSIENFAASVPEGYPSVAGALSVQVSVSSETEIQVGLSFCDQFADYSGGCNDGEWLAAVTLDNKKDEISIGTWDDEFLFNRKGAVPARLLGATWTPALVGNSYAGRGIVVTTPRLLKDEIISFPLHAAWGRYDPDKPSTWFAVGND